MRKQRYQTREIELNESADHVYYNLSLNNQTASNKKAIFNDTRSTAILKNPSEYTMSVIRFSLSKTNIPIFFANVFPKYNLNPFPWDTTFTYVLNEGVSYNGLKYFSLLAINLGNQPDISPLAWRIVPDFASNWLSTVNYSLHSGVRFNNVVYISLINNNLGNVPPTSPAQWAISQLPPLLSNPAPNYTRYSVGMEYLAQREVERAIYEPVDTTALAPDDWTTINESNSQYYAVNMFSEFINMINKALKSCYNRMNPLSPPKVAGAPAPYILYDPKTLIISLVVHKTFDENFVGASTINIFFGIDTMTFFKDALQYDQFFGYDGNLGFDFKLTVQCRGDNIQTLLFPDINYAQWQSTLNYVINQGVFFNGVNYVALATNFDQQPDISPLSWVVQAQTKIPQTYSKTAVYAIGQVVEYQGFFYVNTTGANTAPPNGVDWNTYLGFDMCVMAGDYANLYNWVNIQSVLFVAQLIPVVDEFVPAGLNNPNNSSGEFTTTNSTLQIVTDFVLDVQTGVDIDSNIVFFNQGEYRLANLVSDTPLRSIIIQIYYTDYNNNIFPLYLEPFGLATCKILFRKKHIKGNLTDS